MGYTENMLPKVLAKLGHEVHVFASPLQVYGNQRDYRLNYEHFLGPALLAVGDYHIDGYILHRLPCSQMGKYIYLRGLCSALNSLSPEIVQFGTCAGIDTFKVVYRTLRPAWKTFTECHQHGSVAWHPTSTTVLGRKVQLLAYRFTRTWPAKFAHTRIERCFATAPDCAQVAQNHYGIAPEKIVLLPLGSDTDSFHPCTTVADHEERRKLRRSWLISDQEILSIYTGRFSSSKNPLLLAQAIDSLRRSGLPFKGIFIGAGAQEQAITALSGCMVRGFVKHVELPAIYRACDIAVWPREESMSMLDALACGLPLVANDRMGDQDRVVGNGSTFSKDNIDSLVDSLKALQDKGLREELGRYGREKVVRQYSWQRHGEIRICHYLESLTHQAA